MTLRINILRFKIDIKRKSIRLRFINKGLLRCSRLMRC